MHQCKPPRSLTLLSEAILTGFRLVALLPNNDVRRFLFLILEVVLEDALRTVCVSLLGVERCAGVVGHHAVASTERVLHAAPRVVLRCRLYVPDVTGVAVEMPGLDRIGNGILVADRTASGVDEPGTLNPRESLQIVKMTI